MITFFCKCEPEIEFESETQWREHMINVHGWSEKLVFAHVEELQDSLKSLKPEMIESQRLVDF